jgi:hypothetical protein
LEVRILRAILNTAAVLALLFVPVRPLRAQEVAAYLGFGSAHDSSNGAKFETFSDGNLYRAPSMGGFFAHLGASVFVTKHIGVGAEISWKAAKGDYAGIPYRPIFYNVDAIFRPAKFTTKRFAPELRAGIGGARLRFLPDDDQSCAQVPGCPASNHFQQHMAVVMPWYLTTHLFVRPAFDLHYVNNLSEFGSGWVPEYSVGFGYNIGRRE